ncbi:MAG: hypothetical protein NTV03_03240, partial [Candidatus Nomurabacteria bacterium]|nr:hypothetical protein [Candidatus Nomurabacteria bacterium]
MISLKQAALISGYSQDYLGFLIRSGEMKGIKKGGIWFTTEEEVKKYIIAQKNLHKNSTKELVIKKFFSHISTRNILVFTFLLFIGFSSFAFRDSLQSTSTNLADGWSTFTNELLDNSIDSFSLHKQFADNISNNLTKETLAYTNGISNINDHITSTLTRTLASTIANTKNIRLATTARSLTASVGDSLQSTSKESFIHTKQFTLNILNTLSSTSDDLAYGWSTFTNELLDNSENSFSAHKQFADSLENNLTDGVLAYTNGISDFNDHIASTLSRTLASTIANTKNLGLANTTHSLASSVPSVSQLTASVGDSFLGASNGISDGWGVFINGIINSAENSITDTKKLATSLWNGIISVPSGIVSNWNSYLAILSEPKIITVPIILPPSLVTTATPKQTPPVIDPLRPSGTSPLAGGGNTNTRSAIQKIYISDPRAKDYQSQQQAISELGSRIQGIELALQNSISHNTNQTDRVYDSIINSINSSSENITEEGILNEPSLRTPRISNVTLSGTTIIGLVEAPGTLTIHEPTTLNTNISQVGAYTFSTGTGAVSLNGDTTIASGKN